MKLLTTIVASAIFGLVSSRSVQISDAKGAESAQQYQIRPANQPRGFSAAAPAPNVQYQESPEKNARILSYNSENNVYNYQYAYETENGIRAQESGQVDKGTQAQGGYSYTGDDGNIYTITYTADENGFRPQGSHIPTPPPIPEDIAKALEQNAQDEANGVYDDGTYKPEQVQQQPNSVSYQQIYQTNYRPAPAQVNIGGNKGYRHQ